MTTNAKQFSIGDRVKISDSYFWAKGALGIIKEPPDIAKQLVENSPESWNGCMRQFKAVSGLLTLFWVKFDEMQYDVDGGGPYFAAEINADFITKSV